MTDAVKEITIKASPATIFPYLIDTDLFVRWMGTDAHLVASPGGEMRAICGGVHPCAGTFLEIVPDEKVVFTFGWDVPDHPIPAGSTTVEITLRPDTQGTVLRLVHRGLPDDAITDHLGGWSYYLERLAIASAGGDPGPDDPQGPQDSVTVSSES